MIAIIYNQLGDNYMEKQKDNERLERLKNLPQKDDVKKFIRTY